MEGSTVKGGKIVGVMSKSTKSQGATKIPDSMLCLFKDNSVREGWQYHLPPTSLKGRLLLGTRNVTLGSTALHCMCAHYFNTPCAGLLCKSRYHQVLAHYITWRRFEVLRLLAGSRSLLDNYI